MVDMVDRALKLLATAQALDTSNHQRSLLRLARLVTLLGLHYELLRLAVFLCRHKGRAREVSLEWIIIVLRS